MAQNSKKFIFRPLSVVLVGLATALTIILGVLQVGRWITENAAWSLWVVIIALIIVIFLLFARLEALKAGENAATEAATVKAQPTERLSELDRDLAKQLWQYSSDQGTLRTLSEFSPYEIPKEVVQSIEELARLPKTRAAHDAELAKHLSTLAESAAQWLLELTPLITVEGDRYTTKLEHWVSEAAYRSHDARTTTLGNTGFDLHQKFLDYQRYYASV